MKMIQLVPYAKMGITTIFIHVIIVTLINACSVNPFGIHQEDTHVMNVKMDLF